MARRRIITMEPALMASIMVSGDASGFSKDKERVYEVTSDVPADLRVVGCGWDEQRSILRIAVESATFADVPDGRFAPEWTPTYHVDVLTEYQAAMLLLGRKDP